jgi:hypothetical protein
VTRQFGQPTRQQAQAERSQVCFTGYSIADIVFSKLAVVLVRYLVQRVERVTHQVTVANAARLQVNVKYDLLERSLQSEASQVTDQHMSTPAFLAFKLTTINLHA